MAAYVPRAIRLTFAYGGRQVRLYSAARLEMRALPSHEVSGQGQQAGFWLELRDAGDRVLYRRVLHNPLRHEVEVYPEAPGQQFERRAVDAPQGTFDVVVPDLPGARAVVLFGNLPEPAPPGETAAAAQARLASARQAPARLLARFALPGTGGT